MMASVLYLWDRCASALLRGVIMCCRVYVGRPPWEKRKVILGRCSTSLEQRANGATEKWTSSDQPQPEQNPRTGISIAGPPRQHSQVQSPPQALEARPSKPRIMHPPPRMRLLARSLPRCRSPPATCNATKRGQPTCAQLCARTCTVIAFDKLSGMSSAAYGFSTPKIPGCDAGHPSPSTSRPPEEAAL